MCWEIVSLSVRLTSKSVCLIKLQIRPLKSANVSLTLSSRRPERLFQTKVLLLTGDITSRHEVLQAKLDIKVDTGTSCPHQTLKDTSSS